MTQELEFILKAAGEAGPVIVLLLVAYLIIRVIMGATVKLAGLWRDMARERNAIDAERNRVNLIMAESLVTISETLHSIKDDTSATEKQMSGLRRESQQLVANGVERHDLAMIEHANARKAHTAQLNKLAEIGQGQSDIIARMADQHGQIDALIKGISVAMIPEEIRNDIAKLVLLATCIRDDVKEVLNKNNQRGAAAAQTTADPLAEREA